jgi:hypothetical protein
LLIITSVFLASGFLLSALAAEAEPFKRKASGWLNALDVGDTPFSIVTSIGEGTFGKSTSNTMTQTGEWFGSFCVLDPANDVIIVELPILINSTVFRFANGDLLYTALTPLPPSRLCVDTWRPALTAEIYLDITGGTGKFEGATGSLFLRRNAKALIQQGDKWVHAGGTETIEGEIFLQDND